MGDLAKVADALTRLDQAFLQDNVQAFRHAFKEIDLILARSFRFPTDVCDGYEQVEEFAKRLEGL